MHSLCSFNEDRNVGVIFVDYFFIIPYNFYIIFIEQLIHAGSVSLPIAKTSVADIYIFMQ